MGTDVETVGAKHTLPLDNPVMVGRRLLSLCSGPLSVGYYDWWFFNPETRVVERVYKPKWKEIAMIPNGLDDGNKVCTLTIPNQSEKKILNMLDGDLSSVRFETESDKSFFLFSLSDEYSAEYIFDDQQPSGILIYISKPHHNI